MSRLDGPLRHRDLRLLVTGSTVSLLGLLLLRRAGEPAEQRSEEPRAHVVEPA